jgi:hypothetical protein
LKTLAEQFTAIITPRIDKISQRVAPIVAEDIKERMLQLTAEGRSFPNASFKPTYSDSYVRSNPRKGGRNKPVTLRDKDFALETVYVDGTRQGATIQFQRKGNIFKYHNEGAGRNPERTIFPKSADQVPRETRFIAENQTKKVLSGK